MAGLSKEELEKNRQMTLKVLESSYLMYENSKKDVKENATKKLDRNGAPVYTKESIQKNLELIDTSERDIIEKYIQLGGKEEDLKALKKTKKGADRKLLEDIVKKESAKAEWAEYVSKMKGETNTNDENDEQEVNVEEYYKTEKVKDVKQEENTSFEPTKFEPVQFSQQANFSKQEGSRKMYDVIKLPSRGECYKSKKDKIKVSYLTAYDENMILSPNLYKDGTFFNHLLKEKVLDEDISSDDLIEGDRDAIILWLRATGYGNEYPIIVTDDETGKEFDTTVDLSKINYKKFDLKGDSNGYFTFELPVSKDIIKFKFLSIKENQYLKQLRDSESKKINNILIKRKGDELIELLKLNDSVSEQTKSKVNNSITLVNEDISNNYKEDDDITFTHELTDRLIMQTISVNGISDRKYVNDYILNMNVRDAAEYRKYVSNNEPGIDFNIEVERPKSLGGGSITSFLQLDQFIFINM